jgi:outer membrane protein TolC
MFRVAIIALATVVTTTFAPRAIRAQAVSLEALLNEADSANPTIQAARAAADAASARVPQAGAPPDPTLGIALMNIPVADPSLSREMMTMTQVQLGTRLPWPSRLSISESVASIRSQVADWETRRIRDKVRYDVRAAYHELYFVDQALEVTRRNHDLLRDLAELSSSQYSVGTGVQADVLRAQVELSRLTDQGVTLRERRVAGVARLNSLVGRPADVAMSTVELPPEVHRIARASQRADVGFSSATLGLEPTNRSGAENRVTPLPTLSELLLAARETSPRIGVHVRRVAAEEEALELARIAKLPDVNVSLSYAVRPGFADFLSFSVSAPIPIFAHRRQDQAVREQVAVVAEHRAALDVVANEVEVELASLLSDLRRSLDQLTLLEEGILPQARTGLAAATAAYRVSDVDFSSVLDAQVTLFRQELEYHRLLADFATTLAALERAVGMEVLR